MLRSQGLPVRWPAEAHLQNQQQLGTPASNVHMCTAAGAHTRIAPSRAFSARLTEPSWPFSPFKKLVRWRVEGMVPVSLQFK